MSPKEGGLPLQADKAPGMPYGGSPAPGEDCEQMGDSHHDKLERGEMQEMKMAMADLHAILKQSEQIMQQLQNMETIPGWVQSKITVANQYLTDVSQYIDFEAQGNCGCEQGAEVAPAAQVMRIVAI